MTAISRSRIFVSSVQKELSAERQALKAFIEGDALLRRFFEVFLFEDVPASGRRADDVYLEEVDRCCIYVGLFGDAYGHEGPDGLAPTEREFDRATSHGKNRLIFVKGSHDANRHPKMQALLRKAGDQLIRRRFGSIPELTADLYASLVEELIRSGAIQTGPFDAAACPGATLADVSPDKVGSFLARAQQARGYALGPATPMRDALVHLNLLADGSPSHAAVLLFAAQPQRFLASSEVKCLHFHGTVVRKPIPSYQVYKGDLFRLVDDAVDFVMGKLARAVGTRAASNEAPVTYEIPRDAVAEAIVNAIAHRDYASNASVQVMLFSDRLEVWNPGQLPPSLTVDALRRPHASVPHNPLISEPLFLTRLVERAGSGILDMMHLCREAGLQEPDFRQDGGQFVQTLWRPTPDATPQVIPQVAPQVVFDDIVLDGSALKELSTALGITLAQVTPQVATQVAKLLHAAVAAAKSRQDLQSAAGLADREHFRKSYLEPLLAAGWFERTIPDKPTSRLQQYQLTATGRAWLAAARANGKKPV
jgi:ATP-dependent DNA helicase RecG